MVMAASLLASCAPIDERVQKLSTDGQYDAALLALEEAGAGRVITKEADDRALKARAIFQSSAEARFTTDVQASLNAGLARQAADRSGRAVQLCEWSASLRDLHTADLDRVSRIDALGIAFDTAVAPPSVRGDRRTTLDGSRKYWEFLADSPDVSRKFEALRRALIADCQHSIEARGPLDSMSITRLEGDLSLAAVDDATIDAISGMARSVRAIEESRSIDQAALSDYLRLRQGLGGESKASLVRNAVESRLGAWAVEASAIEDSVATVDFGLLDTLESFREASTDKAPPVQQAIEQMLARAFRNRAIEVARDAASSPLAWAYLQAARHFSNGSTDLSDATASVEHALASRKRMEPTILLDIDPAVNPDARSLLELGIIHTVDKESRDDVRWRWIDPVGGRADVVIRVKKCVAYTVHASDLVMANSQYLSHYEDVPNPRKRSLEMALDYQRSNVSWAESSLESTIRSHNIYPTEYSLIGVNSARNAYLIAIDRYNALISEFNMTPATVPNPVLLPYTFRQGVVRSGFATEGEVEVAGAMRACAHEEVASDNVRIGTKTTDIDVYTRRDDPLELDTGVSATVARLQAVCDEWLESIAIAAIALPRPVGVPLAPPEIAALGWLDNPFGIRATAAQTAGVPRWLAGIDASFKVTKTPGPAPEISLMTRQDWGPPAPGATATRLRNCTCRVVSTVGRGSGALISADGLVLTCAHVVLGPSLKVRFVDGPLAGEYEAEVIRVNARQDVAILRAKGLRSTDWLDVAQRPATAGQAVQAAGFPSLDNDGSSTLAVSEGKLEAPAGEVGDWIRIVADIAAASGSSGGPLVDASDGRIVGVVTHISAPQFTQARASTKAYCMAAPASFLSEWLGLTYAHDTPTNQPATDLPSR